MKDPAQPAGHVWRRNLHAGRRPRRVSVVIRLFDRGVFTLLLGLLVGPVAGSDTGCFGAVGPGCGTAALGGTAYCRPALGSAELECLVNGASIEHDQCCATHPTAAGCRHPSPSQGVCAREKALSRERVAQGLYWTRRFDPRHRHSGTMADFSRVCAPSGSVLAAGEERWCCSLSAQPTAERGPDALIKLRCR